MTKPARRRRRDPPDPFRLLALATIILGLVIVIAGFMVWYFTNRESSLLIGSGLVMATGGGLREAAQQIIDRLPQYQPPPHELPIPPPEPAPKEAD